VFPLTPSKRVSKLKIIVVIPVCCAGATSSAAAGRCATIAAAGEMRALVKE
jgi:hypothetical protein